MAEDNSNERFDVAKLVVLSGWFLTIMVCVSVIGAAIYMVVNKIAVDTSIKEWASACLGFLFGGCVSLVKDFISNKS